MQLCGSVRSWSSDRSFMLDPYCLCDGHRQRDGHGGVYKGIIGIAANVAGFL